MAFAETANLAVKLTLGGNFNSQLAKTRAGLRGFDKDASRAYKAGAQIGTGIKRGAIIAAGGIAFLASQVALGLDSLVRLESQTAQTNAVLKSTKSVAGITADAVGKLSEKYESLNATIGDEVIRSTQNMLLTFTSVRKEAFEPALAAILDMNQALGGGEGGLQATAIRVGKALNDPVKGLTALSRVGVKFTAQQVKQIKALVKSGDLLGAQKIILKELNTEFGGSFAAGGNTTAGKVAKFTDSIEDLQRALAKALLPTIGKVADKLSAFLTDPKVVAEVGKFGDALGELFNDKNLDEAGRVLGDVFQAAKTAAPVVAAAAKTMAAIVSTAVKAFTSLPPEIQSLAIGAFAVNKLTGGLITNIAGGVFGALKTMTVQAAVVNVNGGLAGAGGGAGGVGAAAGGASKLTKVLSGAAIIASIAGVVATQQEVSGQSSEQGRAVSQTAKVYLASNPTTEDLKRSLRAVDQGINDLQANPLHMLVQGSALDELKNTRNNIQKQLTTLNHQQREQADTTASVKTGATQTTQRIKDMDSSVRTGAAQTVAATTAAGRTTATALQRLPAPTVNVKVNVTPAQIQKTTTIQYRYGPATGSRGSDIGSGLGPGGK